MMILLLQTFLLMLGAFLLGASLACFIRRGFSAQAAESAVVTAATGLAASAASASVAVAKSSSETDRFGRALAGEQGPAVPPVFQGQPVVEVQPLPDAAPAAVVVPAPSVSPVPEPAPLPTPPVGPSYTEIAVAEAAAAAAAAKAAEAEAAAKAAAEAEAAEAEAAARAEEEARALEAARAAEEARALEEARAAQEALAAEEAARAAEAEAAAAQAAENEAADVQAEDAPLAAPETSAWPQEPAFAEAVDDLTRIRGIDSYIKDRLMRLGIGSFATIAAWTAADVNLISQSLGFQGRIEQENWIEQAQVLARGDDTGYSRKVEANDSSAPPVSVDGERLHRIIGVDPQSEALLRSNGVTTLAQIAGWTLDDVERFEWLLGIQGRISRENWVQQARILAGFVAAADNAADEMKASAQGTVSAPQEPVEEVEPIVQSVESDAPSRPDYTGLRSVRSEALRGDGGLLIGGSGSVEDLKRIRGIGVLIEKKLNSLGITSYEQVANWTEADIDRISQLLDFKGRIERENWIEQARILASGGQTEFSRRADRGEA